MNEIHEQFFSKKNIAQAVHFKKAKLKTKHLNCCAEMRWAVPMTPKKTK